MGAHSTPRLTGYSHIPSHNTPAVDAFLRDHLTPYLNFHRPCFFAEVSVDAKGRQRRRYPYRHMNTPYEKLKSLPDAKRHLKPGVTFADLDRHAMAMIDNQAAERHLDARSRLSPTQTTQRRLTRSITLAQAHFTFGMCSTRLRHDVCSTTPLNGESGYT